MSIPSLYLSGDDEEELFRLTDPNEHPDSRDESVARLEEESLASTNYDDDQGEIDEYAEPTQLEVAMQELTDEEISEVARIIEEIQNRRESDGAG